MKKNLVVVFTLFTALSVNAQNTLPANGNVGIGTMTPSAKLDVNGRAIIDSTLTVKDSVRFKSRLTVDEKVVFKQNAVVKGQLFRAENNARIQNNLRVNNNIKVDNVLRVDGLTNLQGNVKMPNISPLNNNANDFTFLIKKPNGQLKTVSKDVIAIMAYQNFDCSGGTPTWNNGVEKLFVSCPDVKVGIGTSTPQYKLDVKGIAYSNRLLVGKAGSLTNAIINGFDISNSRDLIQLGVHNATTGGQAEVRFKVTHDGTVFVKELRVRPVANFPDYVFNDSYKLMSLIDLETYIKTNKHLPNMPTANEIAKEGANVGEVQRVLVEKVEELTLYNIELNKNNIVLQKELEELKKEMQDIKLLLTK